MSRTVIVVPCYNEEKRLKVSSLEALTSSGFDLILVNDGSQDGTADVLSRFSHSPAAQNRATVLNLPQNKGKAEAVRQGLLTAISQEAEVVGYLDADFATPANEVPRLYQALMKHPSVHLLIASRIKLLGFSNIQRNLWRHYFSRIFATFASIALDLPIYDTQCGFKLLRVWPGLKTILSEPFRTRWVFDVELIGRCAWHPDPQVRLAPTTGMREEPLQVWKEIGGSNLRLKSMIRGFLELYFIGKDLRKLRSTLGQRKSDEHRRDHQLN